MNTHALKVREALLALDQNERAEVIHDGLQSLDADTSDYDQAKVDDAWRDELRSRIDEIESGNVELLNGDEVFDRIRAKLAANRQ